MTVDHVDVAGWDGGEVVTVDEFKRAEEAALDVVGNQAEQIARLERELAEANKAIANLRELHAAINREPWSGIIAKAEALDALAAWLQGSSRRYAEYVAVDEVWRVALADCISFDGTGPTLPAAIMDALQKAAKCGN